MSIVSDFAALLLFPGGMTLFLAGLALQWVDRKLIARFQNRLGPRWFQPLADIVKLLAKEEIVPQGAHRVLFLALPVTALAAALTAALYVPLFGMSPPFSFGGDLIVTLYLLSLLTLCTGMAGANSADRFSLVGAIRGLTQMFAYEAPFMLALLGPAIAAQSWRIADITAYAGEHWLVLLQPISFLVAMVGLMGKLELPPFDSPEAETEIVAGALTEYSGRGLALFRLGGAVELIIGLTLVTAFFFGGLNGGPVVFILKMMALLAAMAFLQALMARLRIDQTVGLWWRLGALLLLGQWVVLLALASAL
jgi:NADH-quinone oxidoreductase subunit H